MVSLAALWLPILVSAVFVFLAGFVLWTVLPHHKTDWRPLSDEDAVQEVLRRTAPSPGQYSLPYMSAGKPSAEAQHRLERGPAALVTILPPGYFAKMGGRMVLFFLHALLIGLFCAYLGSRTLSPDADYLEVFQIIGTASIMAWAFAHPSYSIWFGKPWSATLKDVFDGVVYGLLTAGVFGWLWP